MNTELRNVVMETNLHYPLYKKGKVRDIYDLGDNLLIVTTDRISAFDVVLPNGIPCKGEALNLLSAYWFSETRDIIPNHLLEVVDSRTVLVKKTKNIKIEFVVRGYLYGQSWENYREGKDICGIRLPSGLRKAQKLSQPILTPTTKADTGHDVELTSSRVVKMIGKGLTEEIEEAILKIYDVASRRADSKGLIVADTKFEFGLRDDELLLIDELVTPDSSRFWPKDQYEIGKDQPSFDKQPVRDYLVSIGWDKHPPAPSLPEHVILETSKRYIDAYERLSGTKFGDRQ